MVIRSILALALGGCFAPASGQFLCDERGICPDGMTCVGGVCRAGGIDAGAIDSGASDAAVDGGAIDGGAIDGGEDASFPTDSGMCGAELCEDGATEDDDCDGIIDEGCVGIGFSHSPVRLHALAVANDSGASAHYGPELARGGLSYYVVASTPTTGILQRADRTALDQPFGHLSPASASAAIEIASVTDDELEMFAAGSRILRASRATRDVMFGAPDPVTELGEEGTSPSISRDGLELYFVARSMIMRSTRADRASAFSDPVSVVAGSDPRLSADGLTLRFVSGGEHALLIRASTSAAFTGEPIVDRRWGANARLLFQHDAARELWLTIDGEDPRTPVTVSVLRVQACDGVCPSVTPISCNAGETRSADGLHCYGLTDAEGAGYGFARDRCRAMYPGSEIMSVHTDDEVDDVLALVSAPRWLGMVRASITMPFTWFNGEPFLWSGDSDPRWAPGHPTSGPPDNCALLHDDGLWYSWNCQGAIAICERTHWPVL
jgi:hypothetical protein